MAQVLCHLETGYDANLMVGVGTSDDAAVYKINDDLAIIETVDFFTPVVDDPFVFGQIAAANALSDVYAMGGKPILALNIVCYPNCLPIEYLKEILKGGSSKVREAGAIVAGGHSIDDREPKYGLAVTGVISPAEVIANSTACKGDKLILTKPLGLGILATAIKGDIISKEGYEEAIRIMSYLNKDACESMKKVKVHACTDITGFGLLGHLYEMVKASEKSAVIYSEKIPVIEEARHLARMGIIPAGAYNNRNHLKDKVYFGKVEDEIADILLDPQTSGGLLISLPEDQAHELMDILKENLKVPFALIGEIIEKDNYDIYVK